MKVPSEYKLKFNKTAIEERIANISNQVSSWCKKVAKDSDVLVIPVMRGGIYFFADLTRKIDLSIEMAPGRARAYEEFKNASALKDLYINLDGVSVSGRHVLLVDDICDSGRTLEMLVAYLASQGAESVKSTVLIHRNTAQSSFTPDWIGFQHSGPEWFVGYGMDDKGRFSNLPEIYTIKVD
jgi:hypoxanthine phosphoribosyltransferase